jgi:microsomal dipeptidase-like Zn-dependent dipeptidase
MNRREFLLRSSIYGDAKTNRDGTYRVGNGWGGGLGQVVAGYRDVRDLERLAKAMLATGFSREDIAAFMGGNIYRVLAASI